MWSNLLGKMMRTVGGLATLESSTSGNTGNINLVKQRNTNMFTRPISSSANSGWVAFGAQLNVEEASSDIPITQPLVKVGHRAI